MPPYNVLGGPAVPVKVATSGAHDGGPAIPVYLVQPGDGYNVQGGPAQNTVLITDPNYPVAGGPALPISYVSPSAAAPSAGGGPAVPISCLNLAALQTAMGGGATPITYLLRDEFTTDRAAGAVNGTAAEPGPGTRAVVDSGSHMTIASAALVIDGGAGWNDPKLSEDLVTRELGRMLFLAVKVTTENHLRIGWSSSATDISGNVFYLNGDPAFFAVDGGTMIAGVKLSIFVTNTDYILGLVMRSSGAFWFIKGGIWTSWTLLWQSVSENGNSYPMIADHSAAAIIDFLRVPDNLWYPTPVASDTFNRADGALGVTNGLAHLEADGNGSGLTWTDRVGTMEVSTNKAMCTALAGGIGISTLNCGTPNVNADISFTRGTDKAGMVFRYQDVDNYLYCYHDGTNFRFWKRVAGVETWLWQGAVAYAAGGIMRIALNGANATFHYNGAFIGSITTLPASTYANHGVYFADTDSSLDNLIIWKSGASGDYSILDQYTS